MNWRDWLAYFPLPFTCVCCWVAVVDVASWFVHSGAWYGPAGLLLALLTMWSAREWYRWVEMEDVGE